MMRGFAILLGFQFIGYVLNKLLVPLPASVLGMILLTIGLFSGWVKLEWVEEAAQFLLKYMMLFFTPIIVGMVLIFQEYTDQLLPMLISLVLGPIAVLLVAGWTVEKTSKK